MKVTQEVEVPEEAGKDEIALAQVLRAVLDLEPYDRFRIMKTVVAFLGIANLNE